MAVYALPVQIPGALGQNVPAPAHRQYAVGGRLKAGIGCLAQTFLCSPQAIDGLVAMIPLSEPCMLFVVKTLRTVPTRPDLLNVHTYIAIVGYDGGGIHPTAA